MKATEPVEGTGGWKDLFGIVWANRRIIFALSLIASVVTLAVGFILPRYYRASATLLPETEKSSLSGITQFADLAQLTGMVPADGELSRLYPEILKSETVLIGLLHTRFKADGFRDSVTLMTYFEVDEDTPEEETEEGIEAIHDLIATSYDSKTGIVSVTMDMKEPQLAADVLNALIAELDNFMRVKRITGASEQLRWIVSRLGEVGDELERAEDSLSTFREKNRRIADSPTLLLQQQRLLRDVEISSTTFIELKKQYELAKIEEIKNTSLVSVLDHARPPAKAARPRRLVNAALMFLLAFSVLSGYYLIRAIYLPALLRFIRNVKA